MLFRSGSKPEIVVHTPDNGQEPKAVVVLWGWMGGNLRQLQKYSKLYEDRGCITISSFLDLRSILLLDVVKADEIAIMVAKEAAKQLRHHNVPLIFHVFSNGGSFPLYRLHLMMLMMQQQKQIYNQLLGGEKGNAVDAQDWKLIRERYKLGGEIFDSCPAYPDVDACTEGARLSVPYPVLRFLVVLCVTISFYCCRIFMELQGKKPLLQVFYSHWARHPQFAGVELYIYSTADKITRYQKLEELVQVRRETTNNNHGSDIIWTKRFEDSGHVQHMMKHKEEYCKLIDKVLASSVSMR